jgi:hypothetical protein
MKPSLGVLASESYGGELHFLAEFFWVVDSSSVYEDGLLNVFGESSGLSFLNSSHSATSMQQSAFLRRLIADVVYWILFFETLSSVCKFVKEVCFLESFIFL